MLPPRGQSESPRPAEQVSGAFCSVMCAALIAMSWWSEPAAATWLQVAFFGSAALWCGLASPSSGRSWPPALFHALMSGTMIWMLTTMLAATGMPVSEAGGGAMAPMSRAAAPAAVVAGSILLAVCCAVVAIPWLARAIAPGHRTRDLARAGQAVMSAGMAPMLLATL